MAGSITVDIWGSCVSREILNYTEAVNCGKYILQNPIHTLNSKPFAIKREQIKGSSRFISDMTYLEFTKKSKEYFETNFKSEFLIIDAADCRANIAILNESKIALFMLTNQVLKELNMRESCVLREASEISVKEWTRYADEFCDFILKKYKESNIIINCFNFARKYVQNRKILTFEEQKQFNEENAHTNLVTDILKNNLPKAKRINAIFPVIGDTEHHLGKSSLHFIEKIYEVQARKLEYLFGIGQKSPNMLNQEYSDWYNENWVKK